MINMTDKYPDNQTSCPFWSPDSMKCRVCKGGLFIPLDDHIDVYCKTPDYPQCLQYDLHAQNHPELLELSENNPDNRRQFQRHSAVHKITLVKLVKSGEIASHFSTVGKTLDLSQGGMRLTTDKPLINDTLIRFSLGNEFPKVLRDGTGQVQWCNKDIDHPGYQTGISFHGQQIIETMGLYLGLHQTL